MPDLEAFLDGGTFGPHRWMIRGSNNRVIREAQFTSKHDAETAIKLGHAIAEDAKEEFSDRIRELLS